MNIKNPEQTELELSEPKIEILKSTVDLSEDKKHGSCVMDIEYKDELYKNVTIILNQKGLYIVGEDSYPPEILPIISETANRKIKVQKIIPRGFDPNKKPPKNWQNEY